MTLLGLVIGLLAVVYGTRPASAQTVRLVHMSDIHAARVKSNPAPRFPGDPLRNDLVGSLEILGRAVEHINTRLRPEMVVITGDLVDRGNDLESLKEVKTRLDRLTCPYYPVIGDHDRRKIYEQVFPGKLDYSFEHGGWHFVSLDSSLQKLEEKTLKWLNDDLAANRGRPTVVMIHRPLVSNALSDFLAARLYNVKLTLENAEETKRLLQKYPDVRLVLSGHTHAAYEQKQDGIYYSIAPALVVAPHCVRVIELSKDRIKSQLVPMP